MKRIELTQGQFALVDDDDYERLNAFRWYALFKPSTRTYYAVRWSRRDASGNRCLVYMHREVLSAPKGYMVDHINHDTLDQQRDNLRLCTLKENGANQRVQVNNTSGFKGVSWDKQRKAWRAMIGVNGKAKHIGHYTTVIDAALAYDRAATERYGEFAMTNKMLGLLKD